MLRNYLAAALRNLERNSLYAGVTIAGLAIGFAAATLIALYVRDELTFDRFVPGHELVFRVSETLSNTGDKPIESDITSSLLGPELKAAFPQIQSDARLTQLSYPPSVRHGDFAAAESNLTWADPDFFRVMPLPVLAGDLVTALDAPDGVVITRAVARKYFGQDAPVGQILQVDGHPMRVNAVLQDLPSNTHLTSVIFASSRAPFSGTAEFEKVETPFNNVMATYIRLRPGQSIASVESGLPDFVRAHFPAPVSGSFHVALHLVPLTAIHLRPADQGAFKPAADPAVLAAIGGVGVLIVMVAAINFVTLMTARASRRAVEVGVRKAAGATRRDLVIQFMGEALLYVVVAAIAAVALAELLLPAFNAFLQRNIVFDYVHDVGFIAVFLAAILATAALAGAYPALVMSRFRPSSVLKGGLIQAQGGGGMREALVVVQFAVLVGLALCATTIARQTVFALNEGTRLNKDQVVFIGARPCTVELRDAMRAVPGVKQAACASAQAMGLADTEDEGRANGRRATIHVSPVDFGFFEVYGVKPLAGRLFDIHRPGDDYQAGSASNPPVVINETAARNLGFASPSSAIGKSVTWHMHADPNVPFGKDPPQPSQIIGVVPDFTFASVRAPIKPDVFMLAPKLSYNSVAVNLKLDGRDTPATLRGVDAVWKRLGGGAVQQRYFIDVFMLRLYIDTIIQGATIALAAVIALSIAALGLFALSAYTTERRTKEIGIRKAMGANSGDILRLLVWQFTKPVLWSNLIAWPAAWLLMTWWLKGFAYHVDVAPWTFLAAAAGALLIAWATVFVHALRVARAKPVGALRYE